MFSVYFIPMCRDTVVKLFLACNGTYMLFCRLHITHSEYLQLISRTVMGIYIYFVVCMFSVYFIPICSDSVVKLIHARNRSQDRFLQDFFLKYPLLIFFTKIAKCILLESNSVSLRLVS
jgi:hypothetical protein